MQDGLGVGAYRCRGGRLLRRLLGGRTWLLGVGGYDRVGGMTLSLSGLCGDRSSVRISVLPSVWR